MAAPLTIERRSEGRYQTDDAAEVEVLPGPNPSFLGTILEVSRSGLRVSLQRHISRGQQVKVKLSRNVIFGEVRYCRSVSEGFQAGLIIQDLVRAAGRRDQHITDDALSLFVAGKGLSAIEVIEVREHLGRCEACRSRLAKKDEILTPRGKYRSQLRRF